MPSTHLHTENTTALTEQERAMLLQLETTIQLNLFASRQVNAALLEIHDKKLYREQYSTFERYLKFRWAALHGDISRMHAWRLLEHEKTLQAIEAENVTHALQNPLPTSMRQTEPLTRLEENQRAAAWALAVENNGGKVPTGKQVADVVHRLDFVDTDPEPQPPPPYEPPNYQTTAESHVKGQQFRTDLPKKAFGYLCDITTDQKHRTIWLTFVSPANPATGKKEYKTKNLRIPFRELTAQGWTPPQGDCDEEEDEDTDEFSPPSDGVREYAERQMAKAKANLERETIADKAQNQFWGKEEEEEEALPGSFLTTEQQANVYGDGVFSEAGI